MLCFPFPPAPKLLLDLSSVCLSHLFQLAKTKGIFQFCFVHLFATEPIASKVLNNAFCSEYPMPTHITHTAFKADSCWYYLLHQNHTDDTFNWNFKINYFDNPLKIPFTMHYFQCTCNNNWNTKIVHLSTNVWKCRHVINFTETKALTNTPGKHN